MKKPYRFIKKTFKSIQITVIQCLHVLCYKGDDDEPPPRPLPPQEYLIEDAKVCTYCTAMCIALWYNTVHLLHYDLIYVQYCIRRCMVKLMYSNL